MKLSAIATTALAFAMAVDAFGVLFPEEQAVLKDHGKKHPKLGNHLHERFVGHCKPPAGPCTLLPSD